MTTEGREKKEKKKKPRETTPTFTSHQGSIDVVLIFGEIVYCESTAVCATISFFSLSADPFTFTQQASVLVMAMTVTSVTPSLLVIVNYHLCVTFLLCLPAGWGEGRLMNT